jgi:hypothetical protein
MTKYILEQLKIDYKNEIKAGTFSGSFSKYKKEYLQREND